MARARNIKPGFFRNADLVELPYEARLFFIGLWTAADREGRLEDRPKQIKMEIFPADSVDCDVLLDSLAAINMVQRYEVEGKRFIQVVNFSKHQNPHRDEKQSLIPAPPEHGASTVQAPCKDDALTMPRGLIPDSLIPEPLIPESFDVVVDSVEGSTPTIYGAISREIRHAGVQSNPSHPTFRALVDSGATADEFLAYVPKALAARGDRFAYLVGCVKSEREKAASLMGRLHQGALPATETDYARSMREKYEKVAPSVAARAPGVRAKPIVFDFEAEDVPARLLG